MPEKTKRKNDSRDRTKEDVENSAVENEESNEKGNRNEDQKEKSYYYDDAYGYEIYDPNEDDDAEIC